MGLGFWSMKLLFFVVGFDFLSVGLGFLFGGFGIVGRWGLDSW